MVQWTEEGIKYEADQRHAEIMVKSLGLAEESRILAVPRDKRKAHEEEEKGGELDREEA